MEQHQHILQRRLRMMGVALWALLGSTLSAMELTSLDGKVSHGSIAWTTATTVYLDAGSERLAHLKKEQLDSGSQEMVTHWETDHGEFAGLPTRFDAELQVLKKRLPAREELRGVQDAVVVFVMVVDEGGDVAEILVKDASDDRIVEPVIDAVQHWQFTPPVVAGKPSRGVMLLPIQF